MIAAIREEIRRVRAAGVSLLIIPGLPGTEPSGKAYASTHDGRLYIDITCYPGSVKLLYVILHEVAHHLLGHSTIQSSQPVWIKEKRADDMAMAMLGAIKPAAVAVCYPMARRNVRQYLQPMIDAEIWHHVDLDVARWAGCEIPPHAIAACTPQPCAADDDDITF